MPKFTTFFLDLFFPQSCVGCKQPKEVLCAVCVALIQPAEPLQDIVSVWSFGDSRARSAIHDLKYRGRTDVAVVCARALSNTLLDELSDRNLFGTFTQPLIVPVPLSPRRKRKRGFNQSELIAKHIADQNQFPSIFAPHVLKRIKDTPPQARIKDKRARIKNIAGAFAVPEKEIPFVQNRDIILVDDVTTTGATLRAARDALLAAGARDILLCAVAH
ncbi:MAG: ComF family protein [Minisyncoccota bacterium]